MTLLKDGVYETTETQGDTDPISLLGAVVGYNAYADKFSNGNKVFYVIQQKETDAEGNLTGLNVERGIGTLSTGSPDTISRDIVVSSSNSDAAVDFGSGTKDVFCAPPARTFGFNLAGAEERTSGKALDASHHQLLLIGDASGGAYTQNLPEGADVFPGFEVTIHKEDSSSDDITVSRQSTDTIIGNTTYVISGQYTTARFVYVGSGAWAVHLIYGGDPVFNTVNAKEYYQDGTRSIGTQIIRKTSDETVNNSSSLQNDDELLASLAANETVFFQCFIAHVGNSTADFKWTFTVPTGATIQWSTPNAHVTVSGALGGGNVTDASGTTQSAQGDTGKRAQLVVGTVRNGANSGNLQLQWAQDTATAVDTKVLTDSFLMVWRG